VVKALTEGIAEGITLIRPKRKTLTKKNGKFAASPASTVSKGKSYLTLMVPCIHA
jgi:hypothetical protein